MSRYLFVFSLFGASFLLSANAAALNSNSDHRFTKLAAAFDKIKGCYWIEEDLVEPKFPQKNSTNGGNETIDRKRPRIASTITSTYESKRYFNVETKKPFKEVSINLMPGNRSPGRSFHVIIDPDFVGTDGNEIRGGYIGPVLWRDSVVSTTEVKELTKAPEAATEIRQHLYIAGNNRSGIRLLINQNAQHDEGIGAVSPLYFYRMTPAKRSDCVNEEMQ